LLSALGLAFATTTARAQGGPPLITDDPRTVAPRHWEINVALTAEQEDPGAWHAETPILDMNYGAGERVQIKLEIPWVIETQRGASTQTALGSASLGARWRFVGTNTSPDAVSTYPAVTFHNSTLGGTTELFLPIEYAHVMGRLALNAEAGLNLQRDGPCDWAYGLVAGYDAPMDWELLAELHGVSTPADGTREWLFQLGARHTFSQHYTLLVALGRSLPGSTDSNPGFIGYLGLQLNL